MHQFYENKQLVVVYILQNKMDLDVIEHLFGLKVIYHGLHVLSLFDVLDELRTFFENVHL